MRAYQLPKGGAGIDARHPRGVTATPDTGDTGRRCGVRRF